MLNVCCGTQDEMYSLKHLFGKGRQVKCQYKEMRENKTIEYVQRMWKQKEN